MAQKGRKRVCRLDISNLWYIYHKINPSVSIDVFRNLVRGKLSEWVSELSRDELKC